MAKTIALKVEGIDDFRKDVSIATSDIRKVVFMAMRNSVNIVKNSAQVIAPYKTGTLRRSIFTDIKDSGFTGIVAQDTNIASYGPIIEFGSKPHQINPVNKKALFWKGALNPYKRVFHPGTVASPFMVPALEENLEKIKGYFDKAVLSLIKTMAGK